MTMIRLFLRRNILFALIIALLFFACVTTVDISDDLSPAELIQRAQEATDRNRYNIAKQYYEALYTRYRYNIDLVITAEYEIAFIHYKQHNYELAREGFHSLLQYYNTPDEALLPQQFKRLSHIVLARMDEKEAPRSSKKSKK